MLTLRRYFQRLAMGGLLCASALIAGCSDSKPSEARLDVASTPTDKPDTEYERLQRQQMLRRVVTNAQTGDVVSDEEVDARTSSYDAQAYCNATVGSSSQSGAGGCEVNYRDQVLRHICAARIMMAVANFQAEPVRIIGYDANAVPTGLVASYDNVNEAAAAKQATYAADSASYALQRAMDTLRAPDFQCRNTTTGRWAKDLQLRSMAQLYATGLADAYFLAFSAYERAAEATVNASDAQRGATIATQESARLSTSAQFLSRAAGAHLLVSGTPGIEGSVANAFCVGPELTPQQKSALAILRDAGVSPADLKNSANDIAAILNCPHPSLTCTGMTGGSVRQRLGAIYSLDLATAGETVEQHYGLRQSDFVAARKYLMQEAWAFARSPNATVAVPSTTAYSRFVGTNAEPSALPSAAWAARARWTQNNNAYYNTSTGALNIDRGDEPDWWATLDVPPSEPGVSEPYRRAGLDMVIAATHIAVRQLLSSTDNFAANGEVLATAKSQVLGPLSALAASKQYLGMVELVSDTRTASPTPCPDPLRVT